MTMNNLELQSSDRKRLASDSSGYVTIYVNIHNKSKKNVTSGNVGLKDNDSGDTQGAYFGAITAGSRDSRAISMLGGVETIAAHFEAADGSGWTGFSSGKDLTEINIGLN